MTMLRRLSSPQDMPEHELRNIITPSLLGVAFLSGLLGVLAWFMLPGGEERNRVLLIAALGVAYSLFILIRFRHYPYRHRVFRWVLIGVHAALSLLALAWIPSSLATFPAASILLAIGITSILTNRLAAYTYIALVLLGIAALHTQIEMPEILLPGVAAIAILAIVIVEFIHAMLRVNLERIRRLQTINEFARRIGSSIEQEKVLEILGEAIPSTLQVDTCFLAIQVTEEKLYLLLTYDGGKYFPPQEADIEGTLSGWVIRNQQPLFIADLQKDVNLDGVRVVLTGNNRNSACWMGVPIEVGERRGVLAVASYTPNVFDRTDLELLENLAQHAALALDNANHHTEVELKAQMDSLTGVYNHGSIVQILENELEKARLSRKPLSVIMVDVDYFKQYNDTYGHQTGDEVLVRLAQTIRRHIKSSDFVGRWGGEEFTIVLPGATGVQAGQVARRLQSALRNLSLRPPEARTLPFPTISQGVAEFPAEANTGEKLIQLADRRLYIAKERGRNQIEPEPVPVDDDENS